ncbi:MAG: hypothetical protein IJ393_04475 [Clostridia bacterium]|nr:hypothetical protein [Clostridia bacterium]
METLLKNTNAYKLLWTEGKENHFGHAYLLQFDDGRNLKTALKTFAKLFFMENANFSRIEKLIDEGSFSDCLYYPAEDKKLTVDDAENIKEESLLSPLEGNRKLFLLGDFAEANPQTQNKLLKLLEEPPEGVVFLLGATTVFPILTTVLSRTKKLEIQPFSPEEVEACLLRIYGEKYDRKTLAFCAAASNGNVGEAQNILEGGFFKTLSENAFSLVLCEDYKLPVAVKNVGETKHKKQLLSLLRLIFRDGLLLKMQAQTGINNENLLLLKSEKERLFEVAEKYTLSTLLYAQEEISSAEKQVQFNAVFPQCIELCMANIRENNNNTKQKEL